MGTKRAFQKSGPDIEKALDLVFIRGTTNVFEFMERRYFEHFGRASKSARYAGWLYIGARKILCIY